MVIASPDIRQMAWIPPVQKGVRLQSSRVGLPCPWQIPVTLWVSIASNLECDLTFCAFQRIGLRLEAQQLAFEKVGVRGSMMRFGNVLQNAVLDHHREYELRFRSIFRLYCAADSKNPLI